MNPDTPTPPRPPEQLLGDVDDHVENLVTLITASADPFTTPQLMCLALDSSQRRPDLLALYLATALQKLATERVLHATAPEVTR